MQSLKIPAEDQVIPESFDMLNNCVSDVDNTSTFNPEERLMAAMFIHALRDLAGSDRECRKDAYKWLMAWENTLPYAISYKDVCDAVPVIGGYREWIGKFVRNTWNQS